jgi:hypothetical protein
LALVASELEFDAVEQNNYLLNPWDCGCDSVSVTHVEAFLLSTDATEV